MPQIAWNAPISARLSLTRIALRTLARCATVLNRASLRIAHWQTTARERRQLRALDPRLLKDLGLSHADAEREAGRPFWHGTPAVRSAQSASVGENATRSP